MPVNLDLGGLRILTSRIASFINGPLTAEIGNAVMTDVMPNIVSQVAAETGTPVSMVGYGFRLTPNITVGAGGVEANYTIPVISEDETTPVDNQYGKFPIVRFGNSVTIVTSKKPQEAGQKTVSQSARDAMDQDLAEGVVSPQILEAFHEASEK